MKTFKKVTAALISLLLIIALLPAAASANDVSVSASATPSTLFDGESSTIDISIYNTTGSVLFLESIEIGTQMAVYPSLAIPEGESKFTFIYTSDFGVYDYYEVAAEVTFSDRVVYSNLLGFTRNEWIIVDPLDLTVDFSFTPVHTVLVGPGKASFDLNVKNTGNVTYTDFTVFSETLTNPLTIDFSTFDLAQGEMHQETFEFDYSQTSGFAVGYRFQYDDGGIIQEQIQHSLAFVTVAVVNPNILVKAKAVYDQIAIGGEAKIEINIKNTGDILLWDIEILNSNGKIIKKYDSLDTGKSNTFTYTFSPLTTDKYIYTVKGVDDTANIYTYTSNEVEIFVLDNPDDAPHDEPPKPSSAAIVTDNVDVGKTPAASDEPSSIDGMSQDELDSIEQAQAARQRGGLSILAIILIAAAAIIVIGIIILIVIIAKKKSDKQLRS